MTQPKNTLATVFALICLTMQILPAPVHASTRQEMPFEKYNFLRTAFHAQDIEYLMGNAEMGGWADKSGAGFDHLWFSDVWQNNAERIPINGPLLTCADLAAKNWSQSRYRHELNIKTGILTTAVHWPDGDGYTSQLFFAKFDPHALCIQLTNTSARSLTWAIRLPGATHPMQRATANLLKGISADANAFTHVAWALHIDPAPAFASDVPNITLKPGQRAQIRYAVTTHFDNADYSALAQRAVSQNASFPSLVRQQQAAWQRQWRQIASIILPPGEYAKWFYRAIYTLYATAGAERFLPGEEQFSIPDSDWHMHSFTYGHGGGWSVWSFACLGDRAKALNMLKAMYQPKALADNVRLLFPQLGPTELIYKGKSKGIHTYLETDNPNAIAFGHEVASDGHNLGYTDTAHWDLQRHLDGFAAASFQLLQRYYPDAQYNTAYAYPVLRGSAELYASLAKWDAARGFYFFPPLLSVSENIVEKSVLDVALAARWTLNTATHAAQQLARDAELQDKWHAIAVKLDIPQNNDTYLEYLDDTQERSGGGYFGIRAFMYLGFPLLESVPDIDRAKARRALDHAWQRNQQGAGMISFITNWFALTEAYLGNGGNAFALSSQMLANQDPSGACLYEAMTRAKDGTVSGITPYFLTGYSSFVLVPLAMLLQSYADTLAVFPALPPQWREVSVYDLPAEAGLRVSAQMKGGQLQWLRICHNDKTIMQSQTRQKFKLLRQGQKIALKILD